MCPKSCQSDTKHRQNPLTSPSLTLPSLLLLLLCCTPASLYWTIGRPGTSLSWLSVPHPVVDLDLSPPHPPHGDSASLFLSLVCMLSWLCFPLCFCLFLLSLSVVFSSSYLKTFINLYHKSNRASFSCKSN